MREFGWILMLAGAALMAGGFFFDIRAPSSLTGAMEIANQSLMHRSTLLTLIGGFFFVGGAVLSSAVPSEAEASGPKLNASAAKSPIISRTQVGNATVIKLENGKFMIQGESELFPSLQAATDTLNQRAL